MRFLDSYTVVITESLSECSDYYRRYFDFEPVFESSWFVLMSSAGDRPVSIAFMHPEHPSSPPDPAAHRGDGSFLTLQVGDADAEYERLLGTGLRFDLPLTDEPWGQRRFGLTDPSGMWVDVVEQTEPLDGWWDQYLADSQTSRPMTTFPADARHGMAIRWTGPTYREPTGEVQPGDIGKFIDFDGPPGHREVVVAFPGLTFVCSSADVEVAAPQEGSDRR